MNETSDDRGHREGIDPAKELVRILLNLLGAPGALVLVMVLARPASGEDNEKGVTRQFEVQSAINAKRAVGEKKETATGTTRIRYAYEHRKDWSYLSAIEFEANVKINDLNVDVLMNRDRIRAKTNDKGFDFSFDKAPEQYQKQLTDSFHKPIYQFSFDKNGTELKRENIAGPSAQSIATEGAVANYRAFHVPFRSELAKWEAEVSINSGASARSDVSSGALTIEKGETGKDGLVPVVVSGELKSKPVDTNFAKNHSTRQIVKGKQYFDPKISESVLGEWDITIKMIGSVDGKEIELGSGTNTMKFKLVNDKK